MFGYIRPYKPDMLVKEYELYKSVYCALCERLHKDYGILAKNILSYDSTFFCIMAAGIKGAVPDVKKHSCTVNPLKECRFCTNLTPYLKMGAAFTVISFYYKLYDDIEDESLFRRILCRLALPFVSRWRKKALKSYAEYDEIVSEAIKQQKKCEQEKTESIDICADPTGLMLKRLMQTLSKNDSEKEIYGSFGYFLGRWIYMTDACDDIGRDLEKGAFNPFIYKFGVTAENYRKEDYANECNEILNITAAALVSSYNKIEMKSFKSIADNVILKGIGDMQRRILFCDEKVKEKL